MSMVTSTEIDTRKFGGTSKVQKILAWTHMLLLDVHSELPIFPLEGAAIERKPGMLYVLPWNERQYLHPD